MLRNFAVVAFSGVTAALSFNGTGQLRTISTTFQMGSDLGCVTDSGMWTVNDALCGTFTGERDSDSTSLVLSSLAGPCTVNGTMFACSSDAEALEFWAWENLAPGHDVLAYSESITYSSAANASEAPARLRTYRTTDPKPWVWLAWTSL